MSANLQLSKNPARGSLTPGVTIFFTGLSGAGKSTISSQLLLRLQAETGRPISLLDGDEIRKVLSCELGFSREHRDMNILRLGYVASEITKHGGIAICAAIAPYEDARKKVREMVNQHGEFIEVYVATPLSVCEQRDPKGLYAKARQGVIPVFTGISDPYEVPTAPEIVIDTQATSIAECTEIIGQFLRSRGYVGENRVAN